MGPTALLAALLLRSAAAASLAMTYTGSVLTESRTQTVRAANLPDQQTNAVEIDPRLELNLVSHSDQLTLGYFPRLTIQGGYAGDQKDLLHAGSLGLVWHVDPVWSSRLTARATYGKIDFFRLVAQQAGGGTGDTGGGATANPASAAAVPTLELLPYENYDLSAQVEGKLAQRLRFRTSVEASRDGGASAEARDLLLTVDGIRLISGLDYDVSSVDGSFSALDVNLARYFGMISTAERPEFTFDRWTVWTVMLQETWRRKLARDTNGWASGGVALAGGGPNRVGPHWLPSAEIGFTHEPRLKSLRVQGGLALGATPQNDRLTGSVVERADLRAFGTWYPVERWTLQGNLATGTVVGGPASREYVVNASARLAWAPNDTVELAVGTRGSSQKQPRVSSKPTVQWNAFFSVSLLDHGRF